MNDIIPNLNLVFEKIFKSVESQVYDTLDKIVNINKNILEIEPIKKIISSNGFIIIANSIVFFLIIYYLYTIIISMYNGNRFENVYHLIIKLLIISVIINNSYFLIEQILELNDNLTDTVNTLCKNLAGCDITFVKLKENILSIKDFAKNDFLSLDGLIKGIISYGSVNVLITFAIRYATMILLIIVSPVAFSMLFSNLTKGVFYNWLKMFITNLFTQIILKILLSIPLMYSDNNSVMYKIILVGSVYMIYKLNSFVKEIFSKFSVNNQNKNIYNGG